MKTKFFTGQGDKGKSQIGRKNFSKGEIFFELIGTLDELNSWLGICRTSAGGFDRRFKKTPFHLTPLVGNLQNLVFVIQAEFAAIRFGYKNAPHLDDSKILLLENVIKKIDRELPVLRKFVISGGSELSAQLDFGRVLARRAEREAVRFFDKNKKASNQSAAALQFLNRLSSVLFALARYVNFQLKIKELNPDYK